MTTTTVAIEVWKSSPDGKWYTVVLFDRKEVVKAGPFDDKDVATMWAQHLKQIALAQPGTKLVE